MHTISIIIIAIGLSMDSFAVSVTNGLTLKNLKIKGILTISFSLAIFQAIMPLIGWLIGEEFEQYIKAYDHWIAFVLLAIIGLKMIYEGLTKTETQNNGELKFSKLICQSVATSIDAFIVGISFALLGFSIVSPILIIGLITFIVSLMGLQLGKYVGKKVGDSVEIFGGLILLAIGIKILIEHTIFS